MPMRRRKPDDRSDNVERLKGHLNETYENVDDAEGFLEAHADEMPPKQVDAVEDKNRRRREAIEGFRDEIEDEAHRERDRE